MTDLDSGAVCLRLETAEDKDFLLHLYISTREAELRQTGWPQTEIHSFLTQQYEAQCLSYRQLYPDATYQLIMLQGETIGRLYLDRGEDEYRLIEIPLLPAFRNQNLGSHLVQSILDEAAEKAKPVSVHVEYINPARRLYQRLGFEPKEDRGAHLFMEWWPDH
ncbi:MAG: GNAT family N-acetyltransferase [Gammaproteobacteria bacterium]|nr:GNAT family N-acetyltransferase [Gammaproteobacteria bacterium]